MSFSGIYGHEQVKNQLSAAISNNSVSHAYIFCGAGGVGKTTVANSFAQQLTQGSIADIIFVTNEHYGIKDRVSLSVETVRASRIDMYTKPYIADKKVFIFPNAQEMTAGAQNALLKVLEEPPSYCIIILITTNIGALLPTIRSRAVAVRFSPLSNDEVAEYLKDKYGAYDDVIIRLCYGSIEAADKLMKNSEHVDVAKEYAEIFSRFTGTDKLCIYEAIDLLEKQKENYGMLLDVMSIMLSDSLFGNDVQVGFTAAEGTKKEAALKILGEIESAKRAISQNRNYGIVISELLLKAWRMLHD